MKVQFYADGVTRELGAPFALCIGNLELRALIDALTSELSRRKQDGESYGWMTVSPDFKVPHELLFKVRKD
jgi:hypothetical protein